MLTTADKSKWKPILSGRLKKQRYSKGKMKMPKLTVKNILKKS